MIDSAGVEQSRQHAGMTHMMHRHEQLDGEFTTTPPAVRCPRCDYDLSGPVATWTEQCPMEGVCSECGLEFQWADLLNPGRQKLSWLYEHARRWWNLRAAWSTAIRALIPWSFWRRVQLHHRVEPRRLALWAPLLMFMLYAVLALLVVALGALALLVTSPPAPNALNATVWELNAVTTKDATMSPDYSSVTITDLATGASTTLQKSPTTEPSLHSTPFGPALIINQGQLGDWRMSVERAPPENTTEADENSRSPSNIRRILIAPDGTTYTALIFVDIYRPIVVTPVTFSGVVIDPLKSMSAVIVRFDVLLASLGFTAAAMLIVLVCPSQWRRRNVRVIHLFRIAVTSFALFVAVTVISFVIFFRIHGGEMLWLMQGGGVLTRGIRFMRPGPPSWILQLLSATAWPSIGFGLAAWLSLFWWCALNFGMQLKKPVALWAFVSIGGTLGMFVAIVLSGIGMELFL